MDEQQSLRRLILRSGLVGGVLALYLTAIGMVETFSERFLIGTFFSLGQMLLLAGLLLPGLLVARSLKESSNVKILLNSALAGFIAAIPVLILVLIIEFFVIQTAGTEPLFRLRSMFINFSPPLHEILTFKLGTVAGGITLLLFGALISGLAAVLYMLNTRIRTALLNGVLWTLGFGLFSENVTQIFQELFSNLGLSYFARSLNKLLFQNKSLDPIAALIIFTLAFAVAYFRVHKGATNRWTAMDSSQQRRGRTIGIIAGVVFLLLLPWIVGQFLSQALFMIGLYIMMGLGLNIVVGYAGLLDLGYVAFFAFGAYAMGVLTSTTELGLTDLTFWSALPICILAGVIWGLMLGFPVLRMRGDYLAIVTLGFGEIIRILFTSDWLAPIEGGPQGILKIPFPVFFGLEMKTPQTMYYLVIVGAFLAGWVTIRLRDSRLGRQWMAMREDEDVAEAMGINLVSTKLLAFAIGAAFSAMAGAILAARLSNIFPHSFNLLWSINALALIIVGGLGSIPGVVVGALILVGLPEMLREFAEYRLLMYGILLIVMMLVRPEGFIPEAMRKRELHAGEEDLPLQPALGTSGSSED
jgi:branched-chain amino acid transport system permease protein